jgi:putative N-acetylmannosamine-6-phosphate epimerase
MMASSLSPAPTGIPPVESAEAVVYLTKEEVDQIKSALPGYTSTAKVRDEWKTDEVTGRQALKLNGHAVSAETFQFPELHDKLRQVTQEINQGRGYVVIRGLDQADLSATDQIVVFLGLASHIGGARGLQNEKGHVLGQCCTRRRLSH